MKSISVLVEVKNCSDEFEAETVVRAVRIAVGKLYGLQTIYVEDASNIKPTTSRMFPVHAVRSDYAKPGPLSIPWAVAEKAYGVYALKYGKVQSLERLAERGGFGWNEMDEYYPAWREEVDELHKLRAEVDQLKQALAAESNKHGETKLELNRTHAYLAEKRAGDVMALALVEKDAALYALMNNLPSAEQLQLLRDEISKLRNDLQNKLFNARTFDGDKIKPTDKL